MAHILLRLGVRGNADLEHVRAAIGRVEGVTAIVRLGRGGVRGRKDSGASA